jgi:hypothetical protein
MGQRHQVYVIAKCRSRYRCIVAWHHQWCYGRLPLYAAGRFVRLVSQEENARIVESQLKKIREKWADDEKLPLFPSSYIFFLLSQSWNIDMSDLDEVYTSGVDFMHSVMSPNMGSTEGGMCV